LRIVTFDHVGSTRVGRLAEDGVSDVLQVESRDGALRLALPEGVALAAKEDPCTT
jgi:GrpB-like predicted nucleotidyltransferase (UPF0157 family)